jgi:hypothetical protein
MASSFRFRNAVVAQRNGRLFRQIEATLPISWRSLPDSTVCKIAKKCRSSSSQKTSLIHRSD